ncbi:MAG TPA: ABC transporter substrate-binding protein, partial [Rhodospirillaceae bacterium]|nr:ABC transporter substrate-binding protein [Rhodospirillaceae bacterium]
MTFAARMASAVLLSLSLAAPAMAQSTSPVRLGVLNDQSGVYADVTGQGSVIAARMAVEDFGGKVIGRPIEVIFADHQNKPDVAAAIATRWFDTEGVDAIIDIPASSAALAVQEVARQKKRVLLVSGGGTSDFTGKACSPYGVQWTYDTYSLAHGAGTAAVKEGARTWFTLTVDYAFGAALERDLTAAVAEAGGQVVGGVKHPLGTTDYSSFLLQAQASKANTIALLNAGGDTINTIKQAAEFGIVNGGQSLVGLLVFDQDIHALGLQAAQGMLITTGFYWDRDDASRAWSKRFFEQRRQMPNMVHAGVYSAVTHYLKAMQAVGSDDPDKVLAQMRKTPVNDVFAANGVLREDGRMVHDMYL